MFELLRDTASLEQYGLPRDFRGVGRKNGCDHDLAQQIHRSPKLKTLLKLHPDATFFDRLDDGDYEYAEFKKNAMDFQRVRMAPNKRDAYARRGQRASRTGEQSI